MMMGSPNSMFRIAADSFNKGLHYLEIGNNGRGFAHLLVVAQLRPDMRDHLREYIVRAVMLFGRELRAGGRIREFCECYSQALELYPDDYELLHSLGMTLFTTNNHLYTALGILKKLYRTNSDDLELEKTIDIIKNTLVERWHFRMLNDRVRNQAYKDAILKTVTSEDAVIDIGCGSGLLSLFASEKKPQHINSVESSQAMADVAKAVLQSNNCVHVNLVCSDSKDLTIEDIIGPASVAIMEIFDAAFFGEGVLETLLHAWKYLLLPNAKLVPNIVKIYSCAVQSDTLAVKQRCVSKYLNIHRLKICSNSKEPYDTEDLSKIEDLKYLTEVEEILRVDLQNVQQLKDLFTGKDNILVKFRPLNDSKMDALVVWFEIELCPEVSITTDPRNPGRCRGWDHAVFQLNNPHQLVKGEVAEFEMSCASGKLTLITKNDSIDSLLVGDEIVSILNDSNFFKAADTAVTAACAQLQSMENAKILDLTPFPTFGLLFMTRGAAKLFHTNPSQMINGLAALNGLDMDNISQEYENEKDFDLIILHPFKWQDPNLNILDFDTAEELKRTTLKPGGILMPYKVRISCRLVYSSEVEHVNVVNNENIPGYKIAEYINLYKVTKNPGSDFSSFQFKQMSEDIPVLELPVKSVEAGKNIIELTNVEVGSVNAILSWFEVQYLKDGEFVAISSLSPNLLGHGDFNIHLLNEEFIVKENQNIKLVIQNDDKAYVKLTLECID